MSETPKEKESQMKQAGSDASSKDQTLDNQSSETTENGAAEAHTSEDQSAAQDYTIEDRLRQEKEIESEINSRPLVGRKEPGFDSLYEELKSNYSFSRKLPKLSERYSHLRRIRGDGNCFYRGFFFRLIEQMIPKNGSTSLDAKQKLLYNKIKRKIDTSLEYLTEVGYNQSSIEFFVEMAMNFFTDDSFPKNHSELEKFFLDPQESMFLIWFCKLLAGGYIKHHWDERFVFFVEEGFKDAEDFCSKEVEPTNMECGQIQIIALCEFMETRICVEYLDQNVDGDSTTSYYFGPENMKDEDVRICLLYRPGHYDIIYRRE